MYTIVAYLTEKKEWHLVFSANSFLGGERIIMWSLGVMMQGMVMVQGMSFMWGVKAHRVKRQAFTGTPGEGEEVRSVV